MMNITLDCLVLRETYQEYLDEQDKAEKEVITASVIPNTPYLMIQGAQLTGGIFRELTGKWCSPGKLGSSLLLFDLIQVFLPSPGLCRKVIRLPVASLME